MFTLRTLLRPHHLLSLASLTLFVIAISLDHGQTAPDKTEYLGNETNFHQPFESRSTIGGDGVAGKFSTSAGKDWISLPYSYQGPSRLLLEQSEIGAILQSWVVQQADPV